jgi:dihydrofolate reductase
MSVDLSKQAIKMSLIVAMNDATRGIGVNGTIPWRLPTDLKYFSKVTTHTNDSSKKNAVLMGKLTWLSIPKHVRPLPNRLNVIISTTLNESNCEAKENANLENILVCKSFEEAVEKLTANKQVETIYAIGGSRVYEKALEYPKSFLHRIYLTRVFSDCKCDTFLEPANFLDKFTKLEEEHAAASLQLEEKNFGVEFNKTLHENNLDFIFEVYEKTQD